MVDDHRMPACLLACCLLHDIKACMQPATMKVLVMKQSPLKEKKREKKNQRIKKELNLARSSTSENKIPLSLLDCP